MLRAAGEMSWVLPHPEEDDFFVYESAVTQTVRTCLRSSCVCDLQGFGVSMLVDVLRLTKGCCWIGLCLTTRTT